MTLLYFGPLRDLTGKAQEHLPLDTCTPDQLWEHLIQRYPALELHRAHVKLAVNQRVIGSEEMIERGSEVALLPPVSGG